MLDRVAALWSIVKADHDEEGDVPAEEPVGGRSDADGAEAADDADARGGPDEGEEAEAVAGDAVISRSSA